MMRNILIVRLGSLGDLVHTLPAVAALRVAFPEASLDWVVDVRHIEFIELVPIVDRRIALRTKGPGSWRQVLSRIRELRRTRYDMAFDFQGLLKSALIARASGARRVVGFAPSHLRERFGHRLYTETHDPGAAVHVVDKNLALLACIGVSETARRFPIDVPRSSVANAVRSQFGPGARRYALLNPGGGWPNKRWAPDRFGRVASVLRSQHGLPSVVLWGPGEQSLARAVADASEGSACVAPPTAIGDLVALVSDAALFVSGDTGPLHLAAAVGTPIAGIYGPTDPLRNGPWADKDVTVSRYDACGCHHKRRCTARAWCLAGITVDDVTAAITRRLENPVAQTFRRVVDS